MINLKFNIQHSKSSTRKAFTLVELLVSIAIFVTFLGVVALSYIGIVRSQRAADQVRKMYSDVRSFTESLAQDMRLGTIDYDCYGTSISSSACPENADGITTSAASYLAIVNKDQTQKVIYWFDASDKNNGKLKVKRYQISTPPEPTKTTFELPPWGDADGYVYDGKDPNVDATGSRTLLNNLVKVTNLTFDVNPPVNPYSSDNYTFNQYQFQPKVTYSLSVQNADSNVSTFHLNFQTTLSSRVYSRASS